MLCNTLEHNENSGSGDLSNLTTLFRRIGLKKWNDESEVEIKMAKYGANGEVKYVVGENEIEYTHNYSEETISKKVKLIVVKSIDVGKDNIEKIGNNKNNLNQHELFEGLAKAIYDKEYKGQEFCYWVTGYNTGGAVANILAAKMIDKGLYYVPKGNDIASGSNAYTTFEYGQKSTQTEHTQVLTNVYAYTFGAPYTVYNYEGQAINTVESKYCSIMNVVNESDIYSYIMPQKLGWSRYGMTCVKQEKKYNFVTNFIHNTFNNDKPIKNDRVLVESDIETIFNSSGKMNTFRSSYYDNYDNKRTDEYIMHEIFEGMRNDTFDNVIKRIDSNEWTNDTTRRNNYRVLAKHLKENNQAFKNARNLSVYYNISKSITPNDVTFRVSSDTAFRGYEVSQDYKTAVRKMMEWYVSHVATYQHNHDNVYQDHTLLGSDEAEEYYNRFNLQNYVGAGNDEDDFLYARNVEWLHVPESNIILYRDFWGRGLYYCQSYADRMNNTHTMVGDDCTGLVMAVIGYYAGDDLKDNEYAITSSENFKINNVGTPTFRWHYRRLSNWLATQGHMYLYEVNSDTTVNDLEFGDILITCDASVTGHAEFYIDSEHTWGWGMKHRTLYDEGKLGWKGKVEKNTKVISGRNVPCFYIKDKHNYYKDTNENKGSITVQDDRPYQYVLSPNPNKRNMTAIFNTEG